MLKFYRSSNKPQIERYNTVTGRLEPRATTTVTIEMNGQPNNLIRSARLTHLDMFITIGNIIGLFFGASLLSLAEIVHLWILHRFWVNFKYLNFLVNVEVSDSIFC